MQNTPTGCGSHLPSILRTFKNQSKSRSVNMFFKCSDFDPNSRKDVFYQNSRTNVFGDGGCSQALPLILVLLGF
jgi:hypothetical protein